MRKKNHITKPTELKVHHGKSLSTLKTVNINDESFDVELTLPNGDKLDVNTRTHGYAVRVTRSGKSQRDLIDVNY